MATECCHQERKEQTHIFNPVRDDWRFVLEGKDTMLCYENWFTKLFSFVNFVKNWATVTANGGSVFE